MLNGLIRNTPIYIKLLILTGTPHAFTKFKNPIFEANADQFYILQGGWMGNRLYEKYGSKIFNIIMHQPLMNINTLLPDTTRGIKTIETVMESLNNEPVGFDLVNTVIGHIPDDSYYSIPYKNFQEVQTNWPDKDWTPIPKNEEEYWKEIERYVDLRKRYFME